MTAPALAPRAITGADRALMYALSGLARSGATRSGYVLQHPFISIGGIWTGAGATRRVLISSLSIQDQLNETPNTCTLTVQGDRPMEGAEIRIVSGSHNGAALFAGNIIRVTEVYAAQNPTNPRNILWQLEGIDFTWRLNNRLVNGRYTNMTGHAIAQDIFNKYAPPGYGIYFRNALGSVDEISLTNVPFMEAMTQIATRTGAHATCDYNRAIVFWLAEYTTSDAAAPPEPLTAAHKTLETIAYTRDLSQIVTRAIVEGGGVNTIADVAPGADRIPVEGTAWYEPFGGKVTGGPQGISYAGVVPGGVGALIGTGATSTPTSAPTHTINAGAGLPLGTYKYAYTWQSGAGETTPSPLLSATLASIPNPVNSPGISVTDATGSLTPYATYSMGFVYSEDPVGSGGFAAPVSHTGWSEIGYAYIQSNGAIGVQVQYTNNPAVKSCWMFHGVGYQNIAHYNGARIANDPTKGGQWSPIFNVTGPADNSPLWGTASRAENTNTTGQGTISISGIAVGPSGVTGRRVYRTARNGGQLKLHTTIANNTATTIAADTTADASLGANAPTTDTAGLISTVGQLLAGSSVVPVSSVGPFSPAGWALIGSQIIRYTGVSATALTGVPDVGVGSVTASVQYGTAILVAPQITGIPASGAGAVVLAITQGTPLNVLVIIDDLEAQAALAALVGGDGVTEGFLQDNRISQGEAISRASALLTQKKNPQETVRYRCRDPRTRTGAPITINLPAPLSIVGTYQIQDVTISGFIGTGHTPPAYEATASSQRFTFEDLLRQMRTKVRGQPS